jgi:hypothetical protein
MNRKEFFRQGGRWVILSGIGLLSAFLTYNQKVVPAENCTATPLCKNCGKFTQCELPQANRYRKDGK